MSVSTNHCAVNGRELINGVDPDRRYANTNGVYDSINSQLRTAELPKKTRDYSGRVAGRGKVPGHSHVKPIVNPDGSTRYAGHHNRHSAGDATGQRPKTAPITAIKPAYTRAVISQIPSPYARKTWELAKSHVKTHSIVSGNHMGRATNGSEHSSKNGCHDSSENNGTQSRGDVIKNGNIAQESHNKNNEAYVNGSHSSNGAESMSSEIQRTQNKSKNKYATDCTRQNGIDDHHSQVNGHCDTKSDSLVSNANDCDEQPNCQTSFSTKLSGSRIFCVTKIRPSCSSVPINCTTSAPVPCRRHSTSGDFMGPSFSDTEPVVRRHSSSTDNEVSDELRLPVYSSNAPWLIRRPPLPIHDPRTGRDFAAEAKVYHNFTNITNVKQLTNGTHKVKPPHPRHFMTSSPIGSGYGDTDVSSNDVTIENNIPGGNESPAHSSTTPAVAMDSETGNTRNIGTDSHGTDSNVEPNCSKPPLIAAPYPTGWIKNDASQLYAMQQDNAGHPISQSDGEVFEDEICHNNGDEVGLSNSNKDGCVNPNGSGPPNGISVDIHPPKSSKLDSKFINANNGHTPWFAVKGSPSQQAIWDLKQKIAQSLENSKNILRSDSYGDAKLGKFYKKKSLSVDSPDTSKTDDLNESSCKNLEIDELINRGLNNDLNKEEKVKEIPIAGGNIGVTTGSAGPRRHKRSYSLDLRPQFQFINLRTKASTPLVMSAPLDEIGESSIDIGDTSTHFDEVSPKEHAEIGSTVSRVGSKSHDVVAAGKTVPNIFVSDYNHADDEVEPVPPCVDASMKPVVSTETTGFMGVLPNGEELPHGSTGSSVSLPDLKNKHAVRGTDQGIDEEQASADDHIVSEHNDTGISSDLISKPKMAPLIKGKNLIMLGLHSSSDSHNNPDIKSRARNLIKYEIFKHLAAQTNKGDSVNADKIGDCNGSKNMFSRNGLIHDDVDHTDSGITVSSALRKDRNTKNMPDPLLNSVNVADTEVTKSKSPNCDVSEVENRKPYDKHALSNGIDSMNEHDQHASYLADKCVGDSLPDNNKDLGDKSWDHNPANHGKSQSDQHVKHVEVSVSAKLGNNQNSSEDTKQIGAGRTVESGTNSDLISNLRSHETNGMKLKLCVPAVVVENESPDEDSGVVSSASSDQSEEYPLNSDIVSADEVTPKQNIRPEYHENGDEFAPISETSQASSIAEQSSDNRNTSNFYDRLRSNDSSEVNHDLDDDDILLIEEELLKEIEEIKEITEGINKITKLTLPPELKRELDQRKYGKNNNKQNDTDHKEGVINEDCLALMGSPVISADVSGDEGGIVNYTGDSLMQVAGEPQHRELSGWPIQGNSSGRDWGSAEGPGNVTLQKSKSDAAADERSSSCTEQNKNQKHSSQEHNEDLKCAREKDISIDEYAKAPFERCDESSVAETGVEGSVGEDGKSVVSGHDAAQPEHDDDKKTDDKLPPVTHSKSLQDTKSVKDCLFVLAGEEEIDLNEMIEEEETSVKSEFEDLVSGNSEMKGSTSLNDSLSSLVMDNSMVNDSQLDDTADSLDVISTKPQEQVKCKAAESQNNNSDHENHNNNNSDTQRTLLGKESCESEAIRTKTSALFNDLCSLYDSCGNEKPAPNGNPESTMVFRSTTTAHGDLDHVTPVNEDCPKDIPNHVTIAGEGHSSHSGTIAQNLGELANSAGPCDKQNQNTNGSQNSDYKDEELNRICMDISDNVCENGIEPNTAIKSINPDATDVHGATGSLTVKCEFDYTDGFNINDNLPYGAQCNLPGGLVNNHAHDSFENDQQLSSTASDSCHGGVSMETMGGSMHKSRLHGILLDLEVEMLAFRLKVRDTAQNKPSSTGIMFCTHPANEIRRYHCNVISHWLGASTERLMKCQSCPYIKHLANTVPPDVQIPNIARPSVDTVLTINLVHVLRGFLINEKFVAITADVLVWTLFWKCTWYQPELVNITAAALLPCWHQAIWNQQSCTNSKCSINLIIM